MDHLDTSVERERYRQESGGGRRAQPRRGGRDLSGAAMVCAMLALVISLAALWRTFPRENPEPVPEAEPVVEAAEVFAPVEYITYRGFQLPIVETTAPNPWEAASFSRQENGWVRYESQALTAIPGIDVSAHQKEIDWQKVADSGIRFAIIRAGYRGYGPEGRLVEDEQFHANMKGALAAGLDVGVYFFSQATSVWEAEEEAVMLLEALDGYDIAYPVVFDWERISGEAARSDDVLGKTITLMAQVFCQKVEQAGYIPGVYFNQDMGYLGLELDRLDDYVFWLAEYDVKPEFYYHFDLWQYSANGTVPGIDVPVDLNLSFKDFAAEGAD